MEHEVEHDNEEQQPGQAKSSIDRQIGLKINEQQKKDMQEKHAKADAAELTPLAKKRKLSKYQSNKDIFDQQREKESNTALSRKQKLMTMIQESVNSQQASVFGDHDSVVSKEFNKQAPVADSIQSNKKTKFQRLSMMMETEEKEQEAYLDDIEVMDIQSQSQSLQAPEPMSNEELLRRRQSFRNADDEPTQESPSKLALPPQQISS